MQNKKNNWGNHSTDLSPQKQTVKRWYPVKGWVPDNILADGIGLFFPFCSGM